MAGSVVVLGAGMVGVSVALHLRHRGYDVALVDRQAPGLGASFGNAGLIQREAVHPHPFPRSVTELARIALNRSADVSYHPLAMPGLATSLLRYWWHSSPKRYERLAAAHARLIATCLDEHMALAREADATDLLRPIGWLQVYGTEAGLAAAAKEAEASRASGVSHRVLDGPALAEMEPSLQVEKAGAIHWTDPYSVSDPHALTTAYVRRFEALGGTVLIGDAETLARDGAGWRVQAERGPVQAETAVVALGGASCRVTRRFGYAPPLFGKRGYHMHYRLRGNAVLHRPVLDADSRFMLIPMRRGLRLTTGIEFAREGAPATPVQLGRAEAVAQGLLPLGERVDDVPWMGVRPTMPDMIPVIGRVPGQDAMWCAFGHAHQGFTLGPTTGRLLSEMIAGEQPFVDPEPYRPDRF